MSVEWERRGPAAWITFNRPDAHNAMSFAMYEELFALCERADGDDEVRVVVLRGAGGRAFVAGTDISQFLEFSSAEDGLRYEASIDRVVGRVEAVRKPTIALVDGFAMGSGTVLAAACDLRICTPAARFGAPIARTVGNCLSMANYARLGGPFRGHDAGHEGGAAAAAAASRRRRPGARGLFQRGVQSAGTGVSAAMTDAIVCRKRGSPPMSRGRKPVAGPPASSACSALRIWLAARLVVWVCASHGSS